MKWVTHKLFTALFLPYHEEAVHGSGHEELDTGAQLKKHF